MLGDIEVQGFLKALTNPELIQRMLEQEDWVTDSSDDVYEAAVQLGNLIKGRSSSELTRLTTTDWAFFLSSLSLPRSLLATSMIEDKLNNFVKDLIEESEQTDDACVITQKNRIVALYRMQLIQKIFSESRANAIVQHLQFKGV